MFDSMRKDNGFTSIACFSSLVVSLIAHTVIVVMLVVVPLFLLKGGLPDGMLTFVLTAPILEKPDIQPPPVSTGSPASGQKGEASPVFRTEIPDRDFTEPNSIPIKIPPPSGEEFVWVGLDMPAGDGGGGSGLYRSGLERVVQSLTAENYVEPLEKPKKPERQPIRIGILDKSRLLLKVPPVYPKFALQTHVDGVVLLEAIIDEEGNVTNIEVIKGHPLLHPAAVDAVRQWKYTPTIQNGEPIKVITTITIIFKID